MWEFDWDEDKEVWQKNLNAPSSEFHRFVPQKKRHSGMVPIAMTFMSI
jgi:hypothetical protein